MMLFDPGNSGGILAQANRPSPVEAALRKLNVEEMTPIEALNKLHELEKAARLRELKDINGF